MKHLYTTILILVAFLAVSGIAYGGGGLKFEADLDGGQEVPPVVTATTGEIEVKFNDDLTAADFELKVRNGVAVLQAHLHCAPAGQNGSVVVFLFGLIPGGFDVDGDLAEFTFTEANITNFACGETLEELAAEMQSGNVYANVHTVDNPGGEVRGQLLED